MKKMLEKRLTYLYTGELVSTIAFVPAGYLLNHVYPHLHLYSLYSFWVSFILLEFLLLQGAIYWYAKLGKLRNEKKSMLLSKVVRRLHGLKTLNLVVIMATIVVFALDIIKWYPSLPTGGLAIALFFYVFAILEYVNYFYVQLSYDNVSEMKHLRKSRKLKRSSISKDFKRMKKLEL